MSGHSKWSNIKRKKGAADAQRGVIFTKLGREIQVAVKNGGADPESNSKLKDIIAKAKSNNMPNDNIQRSIKKAAGLDSDVNYEEIVYEGYGAAGVAVMVRCLTDNRNRSAADVRHIFDKYQGNMGTTGCVSFMFQTKGQLIVNAEDFDEDAVMALMMQALDEGALDAAEEEETVLVTTTPETYETLREALLSKNYELLDSSVGPVPDTVVDVDDEELSEKLMKMIEALEAHDDVSEVFHNWNA